MAETNAFSKSIGQGLDVGLIETTSVVIAFFMVANFLITTDTFFETGPDVFGTADLLDADVFTTLLAAVLGTAFFFFVASFAVVVAFFDVGLVDFRAAELVEATFLADVDFADFRTAALETAPFLTMIDILNARDGQKNFGDLLV